jgi:multidrug efflux pump subunit AcrA (membrane-fusion protein)
MYANVELTVAEKTDALTVPKAAVIIIEGQPFCMVVSGEGSVTRNSINTGIRSATEVEIVNGLEGTEDVIIANAAAFKDGQKVQKASK